MKFKVYDHRNGSRAVGAADRMNVENVINFVYPPIGSFEAKEITKPILDALGRLGWSGSVKVGRGTGISISSLHADVGLAVQFGNISRIYADLLKLQVLYLEEKIASAVIITPMKSLLPRLSSSGKGDNRCNYDRIAREMPVFSKVITVPMLIYGLYTEDEENV